MEKRELISLLEEAKYFLQDDSERPQVTRSTPARRIDQPEERRRFHRKLTEFLDENRARQMKVFLAHPDFRHVSRRSWCGCTMLNVYRVDKDSPSGCLLIGGVEEGPAVLRVIEEAGVSIYAGGCMGNVRGW
jgi:hypothetical protein